MNNYLLIYMRPKIRNFAAQFVTDKVPTHRKPIVILQVHNEKCCCPIHSNKHTATS